MKRKCNRTTQLQEQENNMVLNFVDLDGVLAQTSLGLQRHLGLDETPPIDYNWCDNLIDWSTLDMNFWFSLPVYYETLKELKTLDNVRIVTHCFSLEAIIGKRLWLDKHWPGVEMINLSDKWLLAGPDRILWDDYPEQIIAWNNAGGIANLIERPWNTDYVAAIKGS